MKELEKSRKKNETECIVTGQRNAAAHLSAKKAVACGKMLIKSKTWIEGSIFIDVHNAVQLK